MCSPDKMRDSVDFETFSPSNQNGFEAIVGAVEHLSVSYMAEKLKCSLVEDEKKIRTHTRAQQTQNEIWQHSKMSNKQEISYIYVVRARRYYALYSSIPYIAYMSDERESKWRWKRAKRRK